MKKTPEDLKFLIDVKEPIASYFEWEIFLNPLAKVKTTYKYDSRYDDDDRTTPSFIGKRVIDKVPIGIEVKGESIKSVQKKIDSERKSSAKFRNKCKTMLTDVRKCEYCADRFLCFTEK